MGIQMNQKALTNAFMMISNWKNTIWLRCFLQINSALEGLNLSENWSFVTRITNLERIHENLFSLIFFQPLSN